MSFYQFGTIVRLRGSAEGLVPAGEAGVAQRPVGSALLVRALGVDQRGRLTLSAILDREANLSDMVDS
jgi:hypothetical protein